MILLLLMTHLRDKRKTAQNLCFLNTIPSLLKLLGTLGGNKKDSSRLMLKPLSKIQKPRSS
jgi:hypothetical protein